MPETGTSGDTADRTVNEFVRMNKRSIDFIFGMQKAFFDEMIDVNKDVLERARAELDVATEFASKIAEVHTVRGIRGVCEECSKHQMDALRRDGERLFKHGWRSLDRTAKLLLNPDMAQPSA